MPNNLLWPLKNVGEEVRTALGDSGVEVELTEKDIERCLRDALRHYNRSRPGRRKLGITVSSATKRYALDPASFAGIQGIVGFECVRERVTDGIDPFDPLSVIGPGGVHTGIDTFGDYDQKLYYIERARRISSSEVEWRFQWEPPQPAEGGPPAAGDKDIPVLYADIPATTPQFCSIEYTYHFTMDNAANTGLQNVPDGDTDWFIDYATAFAKTILSQIRGKFKGIVGPDGAEKSIDYDDLKSEGREDIRELKEAMKRRRRPLVPEIE
jgi:hypothetical protein